MYSYLESVSLLSLVSVKAPDFGQGFSLSIGRNRATPNAIRLSSGNGVISTKLLHWAVGTNLDGELSLSVRAVFGVVRILRVEDVRNLLANYPAVILDGFQKFQILLS